MEKPFADSAFPPASAVSGRAATAPATRSATHTTTRAAAPHSADAFEIHIYNMKCMKGRAFLHDRQATAATLPRLLPDGIPYAANFFSFDRLRECGALNETRGNEVSITAEDLRLLYEARCLDQDLPPSWQREARLMTLVSARCKGNFFCLPENGLGLNSAEAIAAVLGRNRRYSILDLSGNRLRDDGAYFIAQLIRRNCALVHIDVASNDIGHVGGILIANALLENNTVVSLDMGARAGVNGNHIGTPGAEALAAVLSSNEVLARLNVSSNGLGSIGAGYLATALAQNHTLTSLDLSSNNLGVEGARILAGVMGDCSVTHWALPRNRLDDNGATMVVDAVAEAARSGHDVVQHLDLTDNNLGPSCAEALARLLAASTSLKTLRLGDNPIGAAAKSLCASLQENQNLSSLSLTKCMLELVGATALGRALGTNHALLHLDLSSNRVKDEGAVELAKGLAANTTLLSCNLASNKIGNNGGQEIARTLAKNHTLRQLNLRRNMMLGATGDAISESLRFNNSVEKLDVGYNDFSYVCVMAIERVLERNRASNKTLLVPKLQEDIEMLAPKENELGRTTEDIELEKRMVLDRSENLMRRGEEARVVLERLRRQIAELEKTCESWRSASNAAETTMRQTDERTNTATTELKLKHTMLGSRIQQEKDRTDRLQRDAEKIRKQLRALEEAEKVQLAPLYRELETSENDCAREMSDAKYEAEKLASLELKRRELQIASNKGAKKKT